MPIPSQFFEQIPPFLSPSECLAGFSPGRVRAACMKLTHGLSQVAFNIPPVFRTLDSGGPHFRNLTDKVDGQVTVLPVIDRCFWSMGRVVVAWEMNNGDDRRDKGNSGVEKFRGVRVPKNRSRRPDPEELPKGQGESTQVRRAYTDPTRSSLPFFPARGARGGLPDFRSA